MKILKQFTIFLIAIFFCGFGTAIITQANLGTTPITALPYVFTFMTPLTFGTTTFIINFIFFIGQIIILKNEFKKTDYFQLITLLFFGYFIDLGMYIATYFQSEHYILKIIMLIIGSIILAFGVTLERIADFYLPGDGLVQTIFYKYKLDFAKVKVIFDISQPILAIIISLAVLHNISGLREGTIISAFIVGPFVGLFSKMLKYNS